MKQISIKSKARAEAHMAASGFIAKLGAIICKSFAAYGQMMYQRGYAQANKDSHKPKV